MSVLTFNALVVGEELPKLRCVCTVQRTNELVYPRGGKEGLKFKWWQLATPYLLGVVTMMKHFEFEEGKGSRYKPVMGSEYSDESYS